MFTPTEIRGRAPHTAYLTTPVQLDISEVIADVVGLVDANGFLPAGTVLGLITGTGLFVPYDDDGTDDGRRTAVGVLAEDVAASGTVDVQAAMYIRGVFTKSKMLGLDTNGIADLVAYGARDMTWSGDFLL